MIHKLIQELKQCCLDIGKLENQASGALAEGYELDAYKDLMQQKANLLYKLPDNVQSMVDGLDNHTRKYVIDKLGGFSHGAGKALSLDSVFYMSALLYPENYVDGDKNDLENFIDCLARGDL